MRDAINSHKFKIIVDCKQNPIVRHSEPVSFQTGEFLGSVPTRVGGQRFDGPHDFRDNGFRNRLKIFGDTGVDEKSIQRLKQALAFQPAAERGVGNHLLACRGRVFEIQRVLKVIKMLDDLMVFGQGEKDSFCPAAFVDNELFWFRRHVESIQIFSWQRKEAADVH